LKEKDKSVKLERLLGVVQKILNESV